MTVHTINGSEVIHEPIRRKKSLKIEKREVNKPAQLQRKKLRKKKKGREGEGMR